MSLADAFQACEETVRAADPNRYLATAFAPSKARRHLFALYAFNHEIAKTAEAVSQPLLGHIRLQWWRETLDGVYAGTPRKHEVAEALSETVRVHALPRDALDALIDARENDLDDHPFADMAALESYGDATVGAVQRLALRILGAGTARDVTAREAGIAYALAGLVRAVPYWTVRGRHILPDTVSVHDILDAARMHYSTAQQRRVSRRFLAALLPLSPAPLYLEALSRPASRASGEHADAPQFRRQMAMLSAYLRARL